MKMLWYDLAIIEKESENLLIERHNLSCRTCWWGQNKNDDGVIRRNAICVCFPLDRNIYLAVFLLLKINVGEREEILMQFSYLFLIQIDNLWKGYARQQWWSTITVVEVRGGNYFEKVSRPTF